MDRDRTRIGNDKPNCRSQLTGVQCQTEGAETKSNRCYKCNV